MCNTAGPPSREIFSPPGNRPQRRSPDWRGGVSNLDTFSPLRRSPSASAHQLADLRRSLRGGAWPSLAALLAILGLDHARGTRTHRPAWSMAALAALLALQTVPGDGESSPAASALWRPLAALPASHVLAHAGEPGYRPARSIEVLALLWPVSRRKQQHTR